MSANSKICKNPEDIRLARTAIEEPLTVERFAQEEGGDIPVLHRAPVRRCRTGIREEPIKNRGENNGSD